MIFPQQMGAVWDPLFLFLSLASPPPAPRPASSYGEEESRLLLQTIHQPGAWLWEEGGCSQEDPHPSPPRKPRVMGKVPSDGERHTLNKRGHTMHTFKRHPGECVHICSVWVRRRAPSLQKATL